MGVSLFLAFVTCVSCLIALYVFYVGACVFVFCFCWVLVV